VSRLDPRCNWLASSSASRSQKVSVDLPLLLLSPQFLQPPPITTPPTRPHGNPPHGKSLSRVGDERTDGSISSGAMCEAGFPNAAIERLAYHAASPRVNDHCRPARSRANEHREGRRQWLHTLHQKPEAKVIRFGGRRVQPRATASPPHPTAVHEVRTLCTPPHSSTLTRLPSSLSNGTAVRLTGRWRSSPNPTVQSHELHVEEVDVIGYSDPAVCKG